MVDLVNIVPLIDLGYEGINYDRSLPDSRSPLANDNDQWTMRIRVLHYLLVTDI